MMPTYVSAREARQNPIRLKTLINQAEDQLQQAGLEKEEAKTYLAPAKNLIDDETFWQEQDEGLALFLDSNEMNIFRLPKRFNEFVVVGESFHITPLIPLVQGNGAYYVLSLDQKRPKLYQGSKFKLMRVDEVDFPESLQEMFDKYYEFHRHIQFHGKTREPNPDLSAQADTSGARQGMFFGQGGEDVDKKAEIQNFFHRFDEELVNYLDGEDIPMVMAGVGYLHPLYKEVNSYPKLLDHGITKDVDHVPVEELHELTWELVKNQYAKDIDQALGVYKSLRDKDRDTTDEVEKIVSAAFYKRIHTLFIAEDAHVWGKFDEDSNDVTIEGQQKAGYEDLLSFSAGHALLNGGNVLVLPPKNIPDQNTAAAILRF
jgi:hypothetical protein